MDEEIKVKRVSGGWTVNRGETLIAIGTTPAAVARAVKAQCEMQQTVSVPAYNPATVGSDD
jgi:hypothetical protein